MSKKAKHYVTIGGFRVWIQLEGDDYKYADYGEQCDDCGKDVFIRDGNVLKCDACKAEYHIHNADGTMLHGETQKEDTVSKNTTPAKAKTKAIKKPAKAEKPAKKEKAIKVPRVGFGPFLREELTKAPKEEISVSKLANTMVKKFSETKRDASHMRGWIVGIHRLLVKKGARVSNLVRDDKKAKAEKPAKAKPAKKPIC